MSRSRAGFTLIELVIVITIIGIISTVVVNSYSRISRGFKSTLAIDNFVIEMRGLQSLALNKQESCYGLAVRDGESIEFVEVPLVSAFEGCGDFADFTYRKNFSLDEGVVLTGVKDSGGSSETLNNFWLLFTPPQGEVVFPENVVLGDEQVDWIELEIKHPQAPESSYVTITKSGIVSKVEPNA